MKNKAGEVSEVIDNLRRVFHAINEYSRAVERLTDLTGPQLWALTILDNAAPIRVSDLAIKMYLRPATVVGILDRLEFKGFVTRTRSKVDRRAVNIELTLAGKEMISKSPEVAQAMLVKGLGELSEEQFSKVVEGMALMVRILGAEQIVPQPLH